jgi:integrase
VQVAELTRLDHEGGGHATSARSCCGHGRRSNSARTEAKARLSYRRAAELFETYTSGVPGGPFTLHQLRHSALTHAAEAGASTPMPMALSGHTSVRSLAIYG